MLTRIPWYFEIETLVWDKQWRIQDFPNEGALARNFVANDQIF